MSTIKKVLILALILMILNINFTTAVYAGMEGMTEHSPELMTTGEEDIPVEKVQKKISYWWYVLGGALIAGGAAAAAAGGGGGGDSGGDDPPPPTTGDVTVTW